MSLLNSITSPRVEILTSSRRGPRIPSCMERNWNPAVFTHCFLSSALPPVQGMTRSTGPSPLCSPTSQSARGPSPPAAFFSSANVESGAGPRGPSPKGHRVPVSVSKAYAFLWAVPSFFLPPVYALDTGFADVQVQDDAPLTVFAAPGERSSKHVPSKADHLSE